MWREMGLFLGFVVAMTSFVILAFMAGAPVFYYLNLWFKYWR